MEVALNFRNVPAHLSAYVNVFNILKAIEFCFFDDIYLFIYLFYV